MDNRNFTIASSAVLITLNVSVWTGRKLDKSTTKEVTDSKRAGSAKAASVTKHLLAEDAELDKLRAYAGDTRNYLARQTLPWGDIGMRLLPVKSMFEVEQELINRKAEFDTLVDAFLANYSVKVSAAAFQLGELFKRDEYPSEQQLRAKFRMRWAMDPVPTAGDFRVDVQNNGMEHLQSQFEREVSSRLAALTREPWERVHTCLTHVQERLAEACAHADAAGLNEKKRAPKLFGSMIDNALDLCNLLDKLNVTNDAALADVATRMRQTFSGVSIESVRESDERKRALKSKVESILKSFDFSDLNGEAA